MISGKNRAKLISVSGSVEFSVVLEERPSYTTDVTEYPIEGGQQYSDHASNRPKSVSIEGIVTGQDASTKLDNIRFWQEKRLSVTYSGRGTYRNFIIKEFRVVEDVSIGDGFRFSLVLQEIKIAIVKTISVKPDPVLEKIVSKTVPAQTQTQVAPISNRGREQPQPAIMGIPGPVFDSVSILKSILNPWSR
jgi:hypothetical protein